MTSKAITEKQVSFIKTLTSDVYDRPGRSTLGNAFIALVLDERYLDKMQQSTASFLIDCMKTQSTNGILEQFIEYESQWAGLPARVRAWLQAMLIVNQNEGPFGTLDVSTEILNQISREAWNQLQPDDTQMARLFADA